MRVREAYRDRTVRICRTHYDRPPSWMPPLGPVEDARDSRCEVCRERERPLDRNMSERDRRRLIGIDPAPPGEIAHNE